MLLHHPSPILAKSPDPELHQDPSHVKPVISIKTKEQVLAAS